MELEGASVASRVKQVLSRAEEPLIVYEVAASDGANPNYSRHAARIEAKDGKYHALFAEVDAPGCTCPDVLSAFLPTPGFKYKNIRSLAAYKAERRDEELQSALQMMTTATLRLIASQEAGQGQASAVQTSATESAVQAAQQEQQQQQRMRPNARPESIREWARWIENEPRELLHSLQLAYSRTDAETLQTALHQMELWVEVAAGFSGWQECSPFFDLGESLLLNLKLEHTFQSEGIGRSQMLKQLDNTTATGYAKAEVAAREERRKYRWSWSPYGKSGQKPSAGWKAAPKGGKGSKGFRGGRNHEPKEKPAKESKPEQAKDKSS